MIDCSLRKFEFGWFYCSCLCFSKLQICKSYFAMKFIRNPEDHIDKGTESCAMSLYYHLFSDFFECISRFLSIFFLDDRHISYFYSTHHIKTTFIQIYRLYNIEGVFNMIVKCIDSRENVYIRMVSLSFYFLFICQFCILKFIKNDQRHL